MAFTGQILENPISGERFELAMFMREFEHEVQAPVAPGLVKLTTLPLLWAAQRRGLDRRYDVSRIPAYA